MNSWLRALSVTPLVLANSPARADAPLFDPSAIVREVPLCKLVAGFVKAPCASKLVGETILPELLPIRIEGLRASQTIVDLDTGDWKSKLRGWINDGLDWLGVPERYTIPKKIGVEFLIDIAMTEASLRVPSGRTLVNPEFDARIAVKTKVVSRGPFHNMTFNAAGRVSGRMYLTVAPHGTACTDKKPDWAMFIVNMELTRLDLDKIPDFIDGSGLFMSIINWGLSKAYVDFPAYKTRGLAVCLSGKCPLPPTAPTSFKVRLGGQGSADRAIEIAMAEGKAPALKFKDHTVLCRITDKALTAPCTDDFVNHMARLLLPLRVPVPSALVGTDGVTVEASSLIVDVEKPRELHVAAAANLMKTGRSDKMSLKLGAGLELKSACDKKSFVVYVRPTIKSAELSRPPAWLMNDIAVAAVNSQVAPIDVCMKPFAVGAAGISKTIDACKLTRAVAAEKCTGPLLTALAGSLFPLTVRPSELTSITLPALKEILAGVSVTVDRANVAVTTGAISTAEIDVTATVAKTGETGTLAVSGRADVRVDTKCGRNEGAVRVSPALKSLAVSTIPDWLIRATLINLGNATIGRWQALCVMGDCAKKQRIDITFPFDSLLPATAPPNPGTGCSFDAIKEGAR
ncbi:MAG: hypothetical protein HYY84_03820 [Deltaproteobacteria bacterium]|nr:hypothetical protein [Deltaproteobacteria bacterium]